MTTQIDPVLFPRANGNSQEKASPWANASYAGSADFYNEGQEINIGQAKSNFEDWTGMMLTFDKQRMASWDDIFLFAADVNRDRRDQWLIGIELGRMELESPCFNREERMQELALELLIVRQTRTLASESKKAAEAKAEALKNGVEWEHDPDAPILENMDIRSLPRLVQPLVVRLDGAYNLLIEELVEMDLSRGEELEELQEAIEKAKRKGIHKDYRRFKNMMHDLDPDDPFPAEFIEEAPHFWQLVFASAKGSQPNSIRKHQERMMGHKEDRDRERRRNRDSYEAYREDRLR